MPITSKAINFFEWIENDPVHVKFSDKLLLILISICCSANQPIPGPRVQKNRREEWIECLLKKMPNSFNQEPGLCKDLIAWIGSQQTCHNEIIPRPWKEPPYGLHSVLDAFCFYRAANHVCAHIPIQLNDLGNAVSLARNGIECHTDRCNIATRNLRWPPKGFNEDYEGLKRLQTILQNLYQCIQLQKVELDRTMPRGLLTILLNDVQNLSDSIDSMLTCNYCEDEFELKDLFLFLSQLARSNEVRKKREAECKGLVSGNSTISRRLAPFSNECEKNQNFICTYT